MKWIVEANSLDELRDGRFAIIDKYNGDVVCDDGVLYVDLRPCDYCQEFTCDGCRHQYEAKPQKYIE